MGSKVAKGDRFGKLVVDHIIEIPGYIHKEDRIMHCKCDCGGEKDAPSQRLECGMILTCGCKLKPRGRKK